jgi:molecular chaperone HtpG
LLTEYSNFVAFPLYLNGDRVNTVEALWLKPKAEITEEQYQEFYRFNAKAWDKPRFTLHFTADAPLDIHALLFVPEENPERFGFGQTQPGVALYCKRVLIDPRPEGLLPEWLRFVRGVIDSADLPLNISRESMQDSALVKKLGQVMTNRLLKFIEKRATEEPEAYAQFYAGFSRFIKEGLVSSYEHRESLASLLRFESSMSEPGQLTSLDDYLSRAKDGQKEIYYLVGSSRDALESGPYMEAFKARGLEVIYFTEQVDEFVVDHFGNYKDKRLVSAAQSEIELEETTQEGDALTADVLTGLCDWWKGIAGDSVKSVASGRRLVDSPVVALLPEDAANGQMRAMMKAMGQEIPAAQAVLEVNPRHALIKRLESLRHDQPELSALVAQQLADQALLSAGLIENPQALVKRMNDLLQRVI